MNQPAAKRPTCAACLRAASACICRWIAPMHTQAALLVLQHPLEVHNAKNSARLLHLSVTGSALRGGEAFEAIQLDALLHADGRTPVLLYPDTLMDAAPSNYRIRKAHAPHQLSSLEAAALALGQLEGNPGRCQALLDAFGGFVQQQAAYDPHLSRA